MWWSTSRDQEKDAVADLPLPPFPPRIAEGKDYESCLAALADDPAGAMSMAESWLASGGGDGAAHCLGLAMIVTGKPEAGAAALEQLAKTDSAPPMARALVLGQAGQARLMVAQAREAAVDASAALALSPADTELLIMRATAEGMRDALQDAVADLTAALRLDAN